jgi:hypothetical protein
VPGGVIVDARPDSRVRAHAEHRNARRFELFGLVDTTRTELANDRAADAAIERVVREKMFERKLGGRFWHRVAFESLAELRLYLWEHRRFVRRAAWLVDRSTLRRHSRDRFAIRRAVRYTVFEASRTGD